MDVQQHRSPPVAPRRLRKAPLREPASFQLPQQPIEGNLDKSVDLDSGVVCFERCKASCELFAQTQRDSVVAIFLSIRIRRREDDKP